MDDRSVAALKYVICSRHVYRPSKFVPLSFIVNFLDRNVVLFTPEKNIISRQINRENPRCTYIKRKNEIFTMQRRYVDQDNSAWTFLARFPCSPLCQSLRLPACIADPSTARGLSSSSHNYCKKIKDFHEYTNHGLLQ